MLTESAGLDLLVADTRVFETELLEQPSRPALIHDGHETLVEADTRAFDLFPIPTLRSNGEISREGIAPDSAVDFPGFGHFAPAIGFPTDESAQVFVYPPPPPPPP